MDPLEALSSLDALDSLDTHFRDRVSKYGKTWEMSDFIGGLLTASGWTESFGLWTNRVEPLLVK